MMMMMMTGVGAAAAAAVMSDPTGRLALIMLVVAVAVGAASSPSFARDHVVGDSIWSCWSIPPSVAFYSDWSNSTLVVVGDALVFRFETGFYDVVQVSRREFEDCHGENPFQKFLLGPVTIPLDRPEVYYFICSIGNYCRLGMKLAVMVQPQRT